MTFHDDAMLFDQGPDVRHRFSSMGPSELPGAAAAAYESTSGRTRAALGRHTARQLNRAAPRVGLAGTAYDLGSQVHQMSNEGAAGFNPSTWLRAGLGFTPVGRAATLGGFVADTAGRAMGYQGSVVDDAVNQTLSAGGRAIRNARAEDWAKM